MVDLQLFFIDYPCGSSCKFWRWKSSRSSRLCSTTLLYPLIFLLALSIYGKTGVVFVVRNGLADPLLHGKCFEYEEDKRNSDYERANLRLSI